MLIIIYFFIAIIIFLMLHKQINFRLFYSTLLMMSYLRFLEQYILVYVLEVWEYKNLPLPIAEVIGVPILLDISLFPLLAYLFIRFVPSQPVKLLIYYFIFPLTLISIEASLIFSGYLGHLKEWNLLLSYYMYYVSILIIHWQYKLFLKTGWYIPENN